MSYESHFDDDFDDDPELSRAMRRNRPSYRTFADLPAPSATRTPTATDPPLIWPERFKRPSAAERLELQASKTRLEKETLALQYENRVNYLIVHGKGRGDAYMIAARENPKGHRAWLRKINRRESDNG